MVIIVNLWSLQLLLPILLIYKILLVLYHFNFNILVCIFYVPFWYYISLPASMVLYLLSCLVVCQLFVFRRTGASWEYPLLLCFRKVPSHISDNSPRQLQVQLVFEIKHLSEAPNDHLETSLLISGRYGG